MTQPVKPPAPADGAPLAPPRSAPRKRVAVVIGAGATKCAAALGLWRALRRHDVPIDMFVGCSGGSLYAAVMAMGYDLDTCERLTRELWTRKVMEKKDYRSMLAAVFPRMLGFDGSLSLIDDRPMLKALEGPFGERTFADANVPLHVAATDYHNGERVVISEGRIIDAVRASIAIPYVWKPWKVGDRMLLDGCMSDPLPVDIAIREGADIILAMGFESAFPRRVKSASRYAFQVNSIYTNNLLRANYSFHNLAHHAEIIPIIPEFDMPVGLFDTDKFPHVIERGEQATEAQMPYVNKLLDAVRV